VYDYHPLFRIDINKTNAYGMPAILFSIIKGAKDCFCALLDNEGIDINAKDKNGDALLHMIGNIFYYRYFSSDMDENKGHYEDVIKMLFKSGKCAAFNEKNEDGDTVTEHAKRQRNMKFYNMVLKAQGREDEMYKFCYLLWRTSSEWGKWSKHRISVPAWREIGRLALQNEQLPLNSDGQQFHQYQQS
jgi:ankyrin repeat protein